MSGVYVYASQGTATGVGGCWGGGWSWLHIDLAGPVQGQSFFLVVADAFSKWVEVVPMRSTTSDAVIRALRRMFVTHGLPDVIVSDNGTQFMSTDFEGFLAHRGIQHCLISPFHPSSNGFAERAVRSAKEALRKIGQGSWQDRVEEYLMAQHTTPCQLTNKSPAKLLMGRMHFVRQVTPCLQYK